MLGHCKDSPEILLHDNIMSDSSEDDTPFNLREDGESDDEHPRKRQRTTKFLRTRGVGFVQSKKDEEDEDVDNIRPSFGGFQNAFNIGEFMNTDPPPEQRSMRQSPPPVMRPSAFNKSGTPVASSFAARQMAKMGYVEGKGLGAQGTGISTPIQAVGTQGRAGLGLSGSTEVPRKKVVEKQKSQASTPGTRTPVLKQRPKAKYRTVADIEAQGLEVPSALKSIIIDATGTENRSVDSPAGFSTPTRTDSPGLELSKIAGRAKLGLEAYAASWDVEMQNKENLESEEGSLETEIQLMEAQIIRQQSLLDSLESAGSMQEQNGSEDPLDRLNRTASSLGDLLRSFPDQPELSDAAIAILESPFKRAVVDWNPGLQPDRLFESLQKFHSSLGSGDIYPHPNNNAFQTLIFQYWFPQYREFINHLWNVHDSEVAVGSLSLWRPLLSPWLFCKVIDSLIIPKLTAALRDFRKRNYKKKRDNDVPPLALWIPEWLSLLGLDDFSSSSLAELRSHVKNALDSQSWEEWKPFFGKEKRTKPIQPRPEVFPPTAQPAAEVTFRELVEEWAMESGLLFQSLRLSNPRGQPLYRLKPEDSKAPGVIVYFQDDVIFDEDEQPYALDEHLIQRANRIGN